jgi:hypothetical protein
MTLPQLLLDLWHTLDHPSQLSHEDRRRIYVAAQDLCFKLTEHFQTLVDDSGKTVAWIAAEILSVLATWGRPDGNWREVYTKAKSVLAMELPFYARVSFVHLRSRIARLLNGSSSQLLSHFDAFKQIEVSDDSGRSFKCQDANHEAVELGLACTSEGQIAIIHRKGRPTVMVLTASRSITFERIDWVLYIKLGVMEEEEAWKVESHSSLKDWVLKHGLADS